MRTIATKVNVPTPKDLKMAAEALKSLPSNCTKSGPFKLQARAGKGALHSALLPPLSVKLLLEILRQTATGNAVRVVPIRKELTTQAAAEVLNVSRPFLISLVEKGEIPARMVGSHRRIPLLPLLEYKRKTAAIQEEALDQLAREAQELKLY